MAAEKNFEDRVKAYLKERGCWFVKYWGGGAYTRAGIPDLLVCCMGAFLAVELKAATGKPEELQLYKLRQIEAAGGFAILLYPDDFDTFKELIQAVMRHPVLEPEDFTQYQHFKKVRQEWEQKLSVSVHLNYGC